MLEPDSQPHQSDDGAVELGQHLGLDVNKLAL